MALTLTLKRDVLKNIDDAAGKWQFEGGKTYQREKHIAYYASTKRVAFGATDAQNTAMLTMTLFLLPKKPPENITLQVADDFNSGNDTGSVSAASTAYKARIGEQFLRTGATLTIQ